MITKRIKINNDFMTLQDGTVLRGWGFNYASQDLLSKTDEQLDSFFADIKSRNANFARIFLQANKDSMYFEGDLQSATGETADARTLPFGFAGANLDQLWYLFDVWTTRKPSGVSASQNIANKLDDLLELAYNNGIEQIRFPIYWEKIQPSSANSYNWTNLDLFVEKAADWGIKLFPHIMNAPSWARDNSQYWSSIGVPAQEGDSPYITYKPKTLAEWNLYLAKKQNSVAKMAVPQVNAFKTFVTALVNRYGPSGNAPFWSGKTQTDVAVVADLTTARRLKAIAGTGEFKVGYKISGAGIPSGARIVKILDDGESFLIDKPIPTSPSNATIQPERITHWGIWNEPDLTGDKREAEVWVDYVTGASAGMIGQSVVSNGRNVIKVPVNLGKNWPQYPAYVNQIDANGNVVIAKNPLSKPYSWASTLVPIFKAAKDAIKTVDPSAKVVFASLTGSNPTTVDLRDNRVDSSKYPIHPSLAVWHKIDLIYGAGGQGTFDSLGYNLYTTNWTLYFDESVGSKTSISDLSKYGIKVDPKGTRIPVITPTLFNSGDYAQIIDSTGKVLEVLKITQAPYLNNSVQVARGQLGTSTISFDPAKHDLRVYYPGINKYLSYKHGSTARPSISLTEWGYDTEASPNSVGPNYTILANNRSKWGIESSCLSFLISKNPLPKTLKVETQVGDTVGETPDVYQWHGLIKMSGTASNGIWVPNGNFATKSALTGSSGYGLAIANSQTIKVADTTSYAESVVISAGKSIVDEEEVDDLIRVLDAAARNDIYIAICGLGIQSRMDSCHPSMDWYNLVKHEFRWAAQAKYWREIAYRVKNHVAVAYYNVMNEPSGPSPISFAIGEGTASFNKKTSSQISTSGAASVPTGTRVIVYDEGHFTYGIVGKNVTQVVSSGNLTFTFTNVDFSEWSSQINVTLSKPVNVAFEIPDWVSTQSYSNQAVVHKDDRYFMLKQGQSSASGSPEPKNKPSKWYELNVLGYENGGWIYAWWAQNLTLTPRPVSGSATSWSQSYRDEWFDLLSSAIRDVDLYTPIASGGTNYAGVNDIKPLGDIGLVHARPKINFATSEFVENTIINNFKQTGRPVVVEETNLEPPADSRKFESNYSPAASYLEPAKQGGTNPYGDINTFRALNAHNATAFIAQDTSQSDDAADNDDSWSRNLSDFKTMSRFYLSGKTRLILPHSQGMKNGTTLPVDYRSWKISRESFTGSFSRGTSVPIFAANAASYFDSEGELQDLDTSAYGSYVISGSPIMKPSYFGTYDANILSPSFKFDSDCLQYNSSWNQTATKNANFDDWSIVGDLQVDNGKLSSPDIENVAFLLYRKEIQNAFLASIDVNLGENCIAGFGLGDYIVFVSRQDGATAIFIENNAEEILATAKILTGTGAPSGGANGDYFFATDTKKIYGPKTSGAWPTSGTSYTGSLTDLTLCLDYSNDVASVYLRGTASGGGPGATTLCSLNAPSLSLEGVMSVILNGDMYVSNFKMRTKPRLYMYVDIEKDTINLAPKTPNLTSTSTSWSGQVATSISASPVQYRVKDASESLVFQQYPRLAGSKVSSYLDRYILYSHRGDITSTSDSNSIDKGNVLNVVSAKENYDIVSSKAKLRGGHENQDAGKEISTSTSMAGCYPFGSWNGVIERDPSDYLYVKNTGNTSLVSTNTIELDFYLNRNYTSTDAYASSVFGLGSGLVDEVDIWALVSMPRWSSSIKPIKIALIDKEGTQYNDFESFYPSALFKLTNAITSDAKRLILQTDTMSGASYSNPYQGFFSYTKNGTWSSGSYPANAIVAKTGTNAGWYVSNDTVVSGDVPGVSSKWTAIPDLKKFFHDRVQNTLPPFGELLIGSEVVSYSNFRVSMPPSTKTTYTSTNFPSEWLSVANYRFHVFLERRGSVDTIAAAAAANASVTVCKQWIKSTCDLTNLPASIRTRLSVIEEGIGIRICGSAAPNAGIVSGSTGSTSSNFSGKVGSSLWTNSLKIFRVGGDARCALSSPQLFVQARNASTVLASKLLNSGQKGWVYIDIDASNASVLNGLDIDLVRSQGIGVRSGNVKIAGMFMAFMPNSDPNYKPGKLLAF